MTDDNLHLMMRESAETIVTSPPPIAAITRAGRRRKRRATGLAAAAVVLLGGAATAAVPALAPGSTSIAPAAPTRDYSPDEVPVLLPDSAFEVGTDRLGAGDEVEEVEGELRPTMDDRCLVVGDGTVPLVWPRGWEGLVSDRGWELLDQDGHVVARAGDTVRVEGLRLQPAEHLDLGVCGPGVTEPLMVAGLEVR